MAQDPIIFAMANPDPGDRLRRGAGRPPRRDRGHRAQRLSQPGQQRARLSVHLPRRARRARHRHQRRDEARGRAAALAELAREDVPDSVLKAYGLDVAPLRPRLPDPQAVRLPRAAPGAAGGGEGRDGIGVARVADRRLRGLPRDSSRRWSRAGWSSCAASSTARGARRSGSSSPRASTTRSCAPPRSWSTRGSPIRSCWRAASVIADRLQRARPRRRTGSTIIHHEASRSSRPTRGGLHEMRRREGVTLEDARKLHALAQLLRHA